jgi:hypothetical protein
MPVKILGKTQEVGPTLNDSIFLAHAECNYEARSCHMDISRICRAVGLVA